MAVPFREGCLPQKKTRKRAIETVCLDLLLVVNNRFIPPGHISLVVDVERTLRKHIELGNAHGWLEGVHRGQVRLGGEADEAALLNLST